MKRTSIARMVGGTALLASLTATVALADAGAEKPPVFTPAAWPQQALGKPPTADETPVVVDRGLLASLGGGEALELSIGATRVGMRVSKVEKRSETQHSVFGEIDGDPDGFVILTTENDTTVGVIQLAAQGQIFEIRSAGSGVSALSPAHGRHFAECADGQRPAPKFPVDPAAPPLVPVGAPDEPEDGGIAGGCSAGRHFDLLVVYTPAARNEAGGTDAIRAVCQLAVDTTNQVYGNSQISPRAVLVERREISYSETNDVETDRDRLADSSDGYMDSVHTIRNDFGADIVVLLVDGGDSDNCGIAFCDPSDSSEGFCVVQQGCAISNFSFPHEIGHLQGCAHNNEDSGWGCNTYCDSYGYRFTGNSGARSRTVMAYNDDDNPSMRIGLFSNPNVQFDGVPVGIPCTTIGPYTFPGAYNASTINITAANRESYRNPKFEVWVQFGYAGVPRGTINSPWPTVGTGMSAVYGGAVTPIITPTLWIKAGTTAETPTFNKPMIVRACGGTAVIGQ